MSTAPQPNPRQALHKQVIATLCYFDIFSKPLTAFEVWWNLLYSKPLLGCMPETNPVSYGDVRAALIELTSRELISQKWGYYFLNGRESAIEERRRRFLIGKKKWDRAVFATRLIRFVPFVRMVAVCNTLAIDVARETSDIDLLIVIRQGRLWMTRLIITFLIQFAGIRRHGTKIAGRICLSFYITDNALDLSSIALAPADLYLMYYTTQVVSLYDNHDIKKKFFLANAWAFKSVPYAALYDVALPRKVTDSWPSNAVRNFGERVLLSRMGNAIERLSKKIQTRHMLTRNQNNPSHFAQGSQSTSKVVISDTMLKFHEEDRREYFLEEFQKRYRGAVE